ncbi:MAG: MBL fold metallo-hydrolase [Candidatus Heimdallarchaeota archaeon]|nr:MBL fold metallo-hydrolase [Candidatus Heimdallarchaeota archaeon]
MSEIVIPGEILPGIHWIQDKYVNCYLIEDGDELILIDAGLNKKATTILSYIKEKLESRTISTILITHHHVDHIGGLRFLVDHLNPTVYCSEIDAEVLTGKRKMPLPNNAFLKPIIYLFRPFVSAKTIDRVEYTESNTSIKDIKPIALVGHTMGSTAYLFKEILFTGDIAVTDKDGTIQLGVAMFAENLKAAAASFKKIEKLDFQSLLPGHGSPIINNAKDIFVESIQEFDD